tara:strand:- start:11 stop:406 length:396 start_codon:yes stop_codon:yes gene_type:complete
MRVEVYWNLHQRLWSVRCVETGRVINHSQRLRLKDVTWVVQPAGRARVLKQQRKNVHAFARGTLVQDVQTWSSFSSWDGVRSVMYNPYKHTSFVYCDDEGPIKQSICAMMTAERSVTGDKRTPSVLVYGGE